MTSKHLLLLILSYLPLNLLQAQNYLRVVDPNSWNVVASNTPGWHQWAAHGKFEEVTIIAEPQGIFTEIGFYATISQGPDAWSWQGNYEIIWQFGLPGNTIVHDSWLWVGQDIIKADVVDFWTALQTYESIVDRNEDPSFLYQLPDNRYEIRIFPLPQWETRRIKMSFLVPSVWDVQSVTSNLLHHLLKSTDYPPDVVNIGMPVSDLWVAPILDMDGVLIPVTDTVLGGSGNYLHYLEVDADEFIAANKTALVTPAPYSGNQTFVSTYMEGGDQFYQLAYAPDWQGIVQSGPGKKSLILLDYDEAKTSLSKAGFITHLQTVLAGHFSTADAINVAITTTGGVKFLSDEWWDFDGGIFADTLAGLLQLQDSVDLAFLLSEGFTWAQNQADITDIFLLAANDVYVYPPVADAIFASLQASIPGGVPFTLLDYQDKNVSIIFFNNDEYHGNQYFYQLLTNHFTESETVVLRETNEIYAFVLGQLFPALTFMGGILDYYTTLENGVCFQRYSLNDHVVTQENKGVILQTGKYLGNFPMKIEAYLITGNGEVWSVTNTVMPDEIVAGDTLMREMWYGPHLKALEAQSSSDEDLAFIIQESINERVLTSLTAFLALEPSQGGEPCIACLYNDGINISDTKEIFDLSKAQILVSPNPASDHAFIQLVYADVLDPRDWSAAIYDAAGKKLADLAFPVSKNGSLEWHWQIGPEIKSGLYFCKVQSEQGSLTGKIAVSK